MKLGLILLAAVLDEKICHLATSPFTIKYFLSLLNVLALCLVIVVI